MKVRTVKYEGKDISKPKKYPGLEQTKKWFDHFDEDLYLKFKRINDDIFNLVIKDLKK